MVFRLVFILEDGERQCVGFSEEFFESFSWDPPYRERFHFLMEGNGAFRVKGEPGLRVEGLLSELRELGKMKEVIEEEVVGSGGMAVELEKLVLLRLLFVLEEGKAYLTAG